MREGMRAVKLLRVLLVSSLVGPALIVALLAWQTYRIAFSDARHELAWTGDISREHASKVFDSFSLVTDRIQDVLDGHDDTVIRAAEQDFHARFQNVIKGLPQIQALVVIDRNGAPLVATAVFPVNGADNFSDRDYFMALKSAPAESFVSQVQTSRINNKRFFGWGRARRDADGAFAGVIDIAVWPQFFLKFHQTLVSNAGDDPAGRFITMVRADGQVLVGYPEPTALAGPIASSDPFFEAVRNSPEGGTYKVGSATDPPEPERLVAFRKVPGQPVYILAGRSVAAILAEWRRGVLLDVAIACPLVLVLFLVTWAALRGAQREQAALAQVRDEMGRREIAEEQLRQSQKLEALGQLTGGIAHDFNNLLTVIRSSVDLLRRPDVSEERRVRYFDAISDTTTRAAKLTGQLLAFARRQTLKPEVFDVAGNVTSLIEMVRPIAGSRITLVADMPDRPCCVDADPNQFDTSVVNMAVNARDAMDGEGRLTIRVDVVGDIPAARGRPTVPGPFVAVAVADTGCGIRADQLERIFEPFYTTKEVGKGTGLGLAQVFGFAKQSGGEVTVESEPGRGTTFVLYLPQVPAVAPPGGSPPLIGQPADGRGTSVLVVEDNAVIGTFVIGSLAELGFGAVLARDAIEALEMLAKDAGRFDVVFSDVVMPKMSGVDLGREIRRLYADLPVVLASGYSHVLAQHDMSEFDLLQKPYSVDQLSHRLRMAAQASPRPRGLADRGGVGIAPRPFMPA